MEMKTRQEEEERKKDGSRLCNHLCPVGSPNYFEEAGRQSWKDDAGDKARLNQSGKERFRFSYLNIIFFFICVQRLFIMFPNFTHY